MSTAGGNRACPAPTPRATMRRAMTEPNDASTASPSEPRIVSRLARHVWTMPAWQRKLLVFATVVGALGAGGQAVGYLQQMGRNKPQIGVSAPASPNGAAGAIPPAGPGGNGASRG